MSEMLKLSRVVQPEAHIAERFMSRRMGGVTIELVNMTIGILRCVCLRTGKPIKLIPASQWKNELKRRGVLLPEVYKKAKSYKVSAHEVDASLIALYGVFLRLGHKPFDVPDVNSLMEAVLMKLSKVKTNG